MLLEELKSMNDKEQKRYVLLLNKKERTASEATELRKLKTMKSPEVILVDGRWKLDRGSSSVY